MADNRGRSEEFKTPPCRFSFTRDLFEARARKKGGAEKFGCTLIFPVSTPKAVFETAIAEACEMKWPGKWRDMVAAGIIKTPFLKGDGKEAHNKDTGKLHPGMGPDVFFVRTQANKDHPPKVHFTSKLVPATPAEFYSGCYGFAVINAFTWEDDEGGKGVSFGITYAQKTGEGEKLGGDGGGGGNPDKWFEAVEGVTAPMPDAVKSGQGAAGIFG